MTSDRPHASRRLCVVAILAAATVPSSGAEVQTWTHRSAADFETGQLQDVVAASTDSIQLSRRMRLLADLGVGHVWAMASEPDGRLVVATGSPGYVLRVSTEGEIEKLYEAKDEQIFALTVGDDRTVYFGSSPSGDVFRIRPNADPEKLFETQETYVWALGMDRDGALLAATGTRGRLYRIALEGAGNLHFQSKQKHLLSLAVGDDGACYVGTSNDGLVYRVDPNGRGFVLYDAPQADVHALTLDGQGVLYAGTGTPERPNLPANASKRRIFPFWTWSQAPQAAVLYLGPLAPVPDAAPSGAAAPSTRGPLRLGGAAGGENSVYQIAPDGVVDEIFREKSLILCLASQADHLLVGTGQEGRLFLVHPKSGERQSLARLGSGQVQCMVSRPDGAVVLGTGTPGKLWVVEPHYSPKGAVVSEVFDAKLQSRWGKNMANVEAPEGASVSIEFRAGNVRQPDDTWSPWSSDSSALPPSRFLQYRATLETSRADATPALYSLTVYYATVNRPPILETLEIPNLAASPVTTAGGKIEIRWKAADPNGDPLIFDLDVRKEGWPDWISIAREVQVGEFQWDPQSMPSGVYRLRITASDALANRRQDALSTSRESEPFVLDRDPPVVSIRSAERVGRRFEVVAFAKDDQTRLAAAAFSVDARNWKPIFPDDGLFDSAEETVSFQTDELPPGAYLLLVRFRDSAGHFGVADAVLNVD
jgi:hypothetical protein